MLTASVVPILTLWFCIIMIPSDGKVVLPNNLRYLENVKYNQRQKDMKTSLHDVPIQNGPPVQNSMNGIDKPLQYQSQPNNVDWNQQSMMNNPFLQDIPEFVPGTRIRTSFLKNALSKRKVPLKQQKKAW